MPQWLDSMLVKVLDESVALKEASRLQRVEARISSGFNICDMYVMNSK